jgi:GTPase SAR1 family protein
MNGFRACFTLIFRPGEFRIAIEWLGTTVAAYKGTKEVSNIITRGWNYLFGKTTVVFTGMAGVGKSVLLDHLTGKAFVDGYKPPPMSEETEKGRVKGKRILVQVVPGQQAVPRWRSLDRIFKGSKPVHGVVHVLANGFAKERSHDAIHSLIFDKKITTVAKYRTIALEKERTDLAETCGAIRESYRKHREPSWLLLAIDKVDLYQETVLKLAICIRRKATLNSPKC